MKKINKLLMTIIIVFVSFVFVDAKEIKEIKINAYNLPMVGDSDPSSGYGNFEGTIENGDDILYRYNISYSDYSNNVYLAYNGAKPSSPRTLAANDTVNMYVYLYLKSSNDYITNNVVFKLNGNKVTAERDYDDYYYYKYVIQYTIPEEIKERKTVTIIYPDNEGQNSYNVLVNTKINFTKEMFNNYDDELVIDYFEDADTHTKYYAGDSITITKDTTLNVVTKEVATFKIRYYIDGILENINSDGYVLAREGDYLKTYTVNGGYGFGIRANSKVNYSASMNIGGIRNYGGEWYTDPEFKHPVDDEKVTKDINLYSYSGYEIAISGNPFMGKAYILDGKSEQKEIFIKKGHKLTIKAEAFDGYKFVEWKADDDTFSTFSEMTFVPDDDYYLSPYFEPLDDAVTVTFHFTSSKTIEQYASIGKPVVFPSVYFNYVSDENDNIRKIEGWYTDEELTHEFNLSTPIEGELNLYAKLGQTTKNVFPIYVNMTDVLIIEEGQKIDKSVLNYSDREKKVFDGWKTFNPDYVLSNYLEEFDFNTPIYVGFELYSDYVDAYNIKFETNGGNYIEPMISSNSKNRNLVLPTPVKIGYTFTGWYLDNDLKNKFDENTYKFTDDITLYAAYTKSEYKLSFNTNGGNTIDDKTYFYGTLIASISEVPVKDGYAFKGWFTDSEFNNPFKEIVMDSNKTLYAKWDDMSGSAIVKPVLTTSKGDGSSLVVTLDKHYVSYTYELQRSTKSNKDFKKVATLTNGSYTDTKLTYGKKYYYRVKVTLNGKSEYSAVVNGTPKPNKVQNARFVSAGSKSIKIGWDKVGVTGYEVQRSTNATSGFKKVKTVTSSKTLTFTNKKLKTNKTYYYRVRAYKTVSGKKIYGAWSDVVTAKTAPAAPSMSVKNLAYKKLNIISTAKGATTYKVYRSTNKKKGYVEVGTSNENGYIDTDLLGGKTYYYKAKACNENGSCSGLSKVLTKKVLPPAPTIATLVSPEEKKVSMELILPDDAEGYELYRSTNKKKGYKLIKTSEGLSETKVEDSVASKKTYYYKIRIYKMENGNKVYSGYSIIKNVTSK